MSLVDDPALGKESLLWVPSFSEDRGLVIQCLDGRTGLGWFVSSRWRRLKVGDDEELTLAKTPVIRRMTVFFPSVSLSSVFQGFDGSLYDHFELNVVRERRKARMSVVLKVGVYQ